MSCCFSSNRVSIEENNMDEEFEEIGNSTAPPQREPAGLIEELRTVVPHAVDLHKYVEKVAQDYLEKMNGDVENLNNLLQALTTVLKERTPPKQKDKVEGIKGYLSWSSKTKARVFCVVAARTFGADSQLLKKVDVEVCSSPEDCDVVLVFCPVTSRVGSDVDDAMRNIPDGARGKSIILVVMHHSRKDVSASETLLNHKHQNVIQNIHVVYHETKQGLIKCDRNDRAIDILKEWSKHFTA